MGGTLMPLCFAVPTLIAVVCFAFLRDVQPQRLPAACDRSGGRCCFARLHSPRGPELALGMGELTRQSNEEPDLAGAHYPRSAIRTRLIVCPYRGLRFPFLCTGDSDANVEFQESLGALRALRRLGRPGAVVESLIVPDERHGFALFSNQVRGMPGRHTPSNFCLVLSPCINPTTMHSFLRQRPRSTFCRSMCKIARLRL